VTVEVIISWRPGDPQRERNLRWVLEKWERVGWSVTLTGQGNTGPWCRAADVTPAVEASSADIIVVADADCWTDGIHDAVDAVQRRAPWAVPHLMLCRLGPTATDLVLAGGRPEDQDEFSERPYKGHPAGTLFVIPRATYLDLPLDPRFVGWGQEDDAANLCWSLLLGKPWRGTAPLWHLFHEPQPRRSRGIGNDANLQLYRRYKAARHHPDRMQALVNEAKEAQHGGLHSAALDGQPLPG
jgi:hypothetical protein